MKTVFRQYLTHVPKRFFRPLKLEPLEFVWIKTSHESWVAKTLTHSPPQPHLQARIARRIRATERLGERPLWEGYGQRGAARDSRAVSLRRKLGWLYCRMAAERKARVVVEFGAAFGVSGMYWLAGIEESRCGDLFSFEVNKDWAAIARKNLQAIGTRFHLTEGTFEEHIAEVLAGRKIGIALIDAIHTSEFVNRQFEIVLTHLEPGGIVVLDDVDFSDDMAQCWSAIANDPRVLASVAVNEHLGVIETCRV